MFYAAHSPASGIASVPDKLQIRVPAGQTIVSVSHGVAGAACLLNLEVGQTPDDWESTHLTLKKSAIINSGGHQVWTGRLKAVNDIYVKAWARSVSAGGSHGVVVFTEES